MFHIVWFWIPLIIFIAFNKFKCTSWPARHTHAHPPPQSLKSNPKGIHPTPRQPSLSKSPFKCSKRQTETPCTPRPPPLPCTQHPYFSSWLGTIKCSWEGSSHPDRQVLEWVGGGSLQGCGNCSQTAVCWSPRRSVLPERHSGGCP